MRWITSLFCPMCFSWGTGNRCEDHDPITARISNVCSPQDLIVEACIQSFATSFSDWTYEEKQTEFNGRKYITSSTLKSDKIEIGFGPIELKRVGVGSSSVGHKRTHTCCVGSLWYQDVKNESIVKTGFVNDVPMSSKNITKIYKAWKELSDKAAEAERVAKLAAKKMEDNERAWNLAEELLGMKRNELGALVPVDRPLGDER